MALPAPDDVADIPITIIQGSDFLLSLQLTDDLGAPVDDMTGYTAEAKIRADFNPASAVIQVLTASLVSGPNASWAITLTKAQTTALTRPAGAPVTQRENEIGYYDFEITGSGKTYRYVEGKAILSSEVTF
jgi:hypothetical protein